jgi:hypothetical protein
MRHQPIERVERRRQQLPRLSRVAEVVRPFTEESGPPPRTCSLARMR